MSTVTLSQPINWIAAGCKRSFIEREFSGGGGAKFVTITPNDARELLANNPENRTMSGQKLAQYTADIKAGNWALNGEAIIVASDGCLNDGQHRLTACIQADTAFEALLVVGVRRETRTTVDQGIARTAGNVMTMRGTLNANSVSTMARMALAFERAKGRNFGRPSYLTTAELTAYYDANAEALQEAFRFGRRAPASASVLAQPTLFGFWAYLLPHEAGRAYLEQVMRGENIGKGDPAFAVRERIASMGKVARQTKTEAVLRGWVAFRNGRSLLSVKINGELPAL